MTDNESEIIDLLGKGWSYSQIQEQLQVSSKTIAATKKAYFPSMESSADVLSEDTFQLRPEPPTAVKTYPIETKINKITLLKNKLKMNNDNDYEEDEEEITTQLGLEIYQAKLTHKLEMAKLEASRENNERADFHREQEKALVKSTLMKDRLILLFSIKGIVESCEDAEYSYEDIENMLEEAKKKLVESEKFCFINGITIEPTDSISMLKRVVSILKDFLGDMEEDESYELDFDGAFRRQVGRANFSKF